jgi:hypothetical protein
MQLWAGRTSHRRTSRRSPAASRPLRAGRSTSFWTTSTPSTFPAATSPCGARSSAASAASIPPSALPVTTWICAGVCRRTSWGSASRPPRWSGTGAAIPSAATFGNSAGTVVLRRSWSASGPRSTTSEAIRRGRVASTDRAARCGSDAHGGSTTAAGDRASSSACTSRDPTGPARSRSHRSGGSSWGRSARSRCSPSRGSRSSSQPASSRWPSCSP